MAGTDGNRSLLLSLAFLFVVIQVVAVLSGAAPVLEGGLAGPDSYMRMVRVEQLVESGEWFDSVIERANAPFGIELHWTRIHDLILILGALPFALFMPIGDALYSSAVIVPPALLLATVLAAIWAAAPILERQDRLYVGLAALMQSTVLTYGLAGRPDHHVDQFLVFVVAIGLVLRLAGAPAERRLALLLGAVSALGLWISPESLILTALVFVFFTGLWIRYGSSRLPACQGLALGFAVLVWIALLVERGPAAILEVDTDRISLIHGVASLGPLFFWYAMPLLHNRPPARTALRRLIVVAAAAGAGSAALVALFPQLLSNPMAGEAMAGSVWLDQIEELEPLLPVDMYSLGRFIIVLGLPVLTLGLAARRALQGLEIWIFLFAVALVFLALACLQYRSAPYAQLTAVILYGALIASARPWIRRLRPAMSSLTMTLLIVAVPLAGFPIAGSAIIGLSGEERSGPGGAACDTGRFSAYLNESSDVTGVRETILAGINYGPELLYRTPHRVVGLPYHRSNASILDTYRVLDGPDTDLAQRIVAERGVTLILLCPGSAERSPFVIQGVTQGLARDLENDVIPRWLREIPLPAGVRPFRLFRVVTDR